jgi:glycosyltransferase involved in cell wall biosynthesis
MKPRILWCNECSVLKTGYATYGNEVLRRLHSTQKYTLGEHAIYVAASDSRIQHLPWTVYANLPDENNPADVQRYEAAPQNQFGEWRWEDICLDFKPHIVMDIRDFWMMSHEYRSPFRPLYNWAIMPTVDAFPQNQEWLSTYADADCVFTYQDWSAQILDHEGGGKIKLAGTASPAADKAFRPMDKKAIKAKWGLEDKLIIGTVMRNQRRKLFPDLFASFRVFLNECERDDIILHCHTSYPDMGWRIPDYLLRYDLTTKVTFTYKCKECGFAFPDLFHDIVHICPRCNNMAASFVSVQDGIDNQTFAEIYNLFDVYVQYANSEGFGMPQLEAAACGVPVLAVDYSAMTDAVRKLRGQPIPPLALSVELETGCFRAIPDNEELVKILLQFFQLSDTERARMGAETSMAYSHHYSWDRTAKRWEEYFDTIDIDHYERLWRQPPRIIEMPDSIPNGLNNVQFARWIIMTFLKDPRFINSYLEARLIRDLNYGVTAPGLAGMYFNDDSASPMFHKPHWQTFDRNVAVGHFAELAKRHNMWEQRRWQSLNA